MSLSGSLEIFPLEEVLRMLARSRQNGCLRVDASVPGRVYLQEGSLTYATVGEDDVIRDQLIASGVVTEESLSRLEVSRGTLVEALAPDASSAALTDLIREQCVEALYRIRKQGNGRFEFALDAIPRYATGQMFDVEALVSEAERRAAEWSDIEAVIPDLSTPWRMVPEIEEDSVTLSDTAWRFLAALDGACPIDQLAGRLGLTTFQTARHVAELSRARLVEPVATEVSQPGYGQPHSVASPVEESRTWWDEEASMATPEPPAVVEPDAEPAVVRLEEERDESFLETVFSQLEEGEQTDEPEDLDPEDDAGFGLLRRRGLGAAFRELADG